MIPSVVECVDKPHCTCVDIVQHVFHTGEFCGQSSAVVELRSTYPTVEQIRSALCCSVSSPRSSTTDR